MSQRGAATDTVDITNAEALEILNSNPLTRDFQRKTLDALRRVTKIGADRARELVKELVERFGLVTVTAIQIANTLPSTIDELRAILVGGRGREYSDRELQEMLEIIKKYRS